MKEITGDLIDLFEKGHFDVIVHGCNCGNNMGKGIAKTIRIKFPQAWEADQSTRKWWMGKMGTISFAEVKCGVVVNAYTQYRWWLNAGEKPPLVDYEAVRNCFKEIRNQFGGKDLKFGIPLIGCGLARGDWSIVSKIIEEEMSGEDITLVKL